MGTLIAVMLLGCATMPPPAPPPKPRLFWDAFAKGRIDEALPLAQKEFDQGRGDTLVRMVLAEAYAQKGRCVEAIPHIRFMLAEMEGRTLLLKEYYGLSGAQAACIVQAEPSEKSLDEALALVLGSNYQACDLGGLSEWVRKIYTPKKQKVVFREERLCNTVFGPANVKVLLDAERKRVLCAASHSSKEIWDRLAGEWTCLAQMHATFGYHYAGAFAAADRAGLPRIAAGARRGVIVMSDQLKTDEREMRKCNEEGAKARASSAAIFDFFLNLVSSTDQNQLAINTVGGMAKLDAELRNASVPGEGSPEVRAVADDLLVQIGKAEK